jgi:hypothetical protein
MQVVIDEHASIANSNLTTTFLLSRIGRLFIFRVREIVSRNDLVPCHSWHTKPIGAVGRSSDVRKESTVENNVDAAMSYIRHSDGTTG